MTSDADLTLIFETHSTSVDNEASVASGWFDAALSSTGEEQARTLGARRRDDDLAAVFCSDLARAVRTAEIAFGGRGIEIVRDPRLRECNYGTFTRHPLGSVELRRRLHVTAPFPRGESYQQVVGRVSAWLGEVAAKFPGRTVLVVGHRATFYALEHLVRNVPLDQAVTSPWHWQPGWTYRLTRSI